VSEIVVVESGAS